MIPTPIQHTPPAWCVRQHKAARILPASVVEALVSASKIKDETERHAAISDITKGVRKDFPEYFRKPGDPILKFSDEGDKNAER